MAGEPEELLQPEDPALPETPPGETPETPPGDPPPPKPGEEKSAYQKRIDQLTREKHEERRKREATEAELATLKRKADAGARPEPPDLAVLTNADGMLDPAKYKRAMMEYEDKRDKWLDAQKVTPPAASPEPESAPDQSQAIAAFRDGIAALAEQHPDAMEVIERPVFSPLMRDVVWTTEMGPQLAYYLGTHQAEALKIANLPDAQAYREMGKLEAKLATTPPATPARTVSGAPAPIAPVGGNAPITKDPEKMTTEEYMAYERQRTIDRMKANPLAV